MQKILVTGACGFIWRNLVKALLDKGFTVVSLDNFYRWDINDLIGTLGDNLIYDHKFIQGDILDKELIDSIVAECDTVIHLAWVSQVLTSLKSPNDTFNYNVIWTKNIVTSCIKHNVKLIFSSSREVYWKSNQIKITEDSNLKAENPYWSSKIIDEEIITSAGNSFGLDYLIFRLSNVYWYYDKWRIIPILINNAIKWELITLFWGDKVIDFVHIDDVVSAFIKWVNKEYLWKHILNIWSWIPVVLKDLAKMVIFETKSKSKVNITENRIGEVDYFCSNIDKAYNILDWKPEVLLKDWIEDLVSRLTTIQSNKNLGKPTIGFIWQGWIWKNYADEFEERGYKVVRYGLEEEYVNNKDGILNCSIVFIAVPTPTTIKWFDISIVKSCLELINPWSSVVIKSTLIPGTTEILQNEFPNLYIFHSPEFLREITAKYDVKYPSRNIIWLPHHTKDFVSRANQILHILPKSKYNKILDSRSAEFIKYISNCFLANKILFFNAVYDLIQEMELNYDNIIEWVTADPRIGESHTKILFPSGHNQDLVGRWAGWHCFIKDYQAFLDLYMEHMGNNIWYQMLSSMKDYNLSLLRSTNKDIDILNQIYEN